MKNMQYNPYWWPNCEIFAYWGKSGLRIQITDEVTFIPVAHIYRNSSVIVDLATVPQNVFLVRVLANDVF